MTTESTLLCPKCSNKVTATDTFCGSCGQQLKAGDAVPAPVAPAPAAAQTATPAPPAATPAPAGTPAPVASPVMANGDPSRNMRAIVGISLVGASFVIGIGILFSPVITFVSMALYLVALVFGILGLKSQKRGLSITAIVLSIVLGIMTPFAGLASLGFDACNHPEKYDLTTDDIKCSAEVTSPSEGIDGAFRIMLDR